MTRIRPHRLVALLALAVSLVLLPVAVEATPRDDSRHESGVVRLLTATWDWVSNLWGAGGGSLIPDRAPSPEPTIPAEVLRSPVETEDEPVRSHTRERRGL